MATIKDFFAEKAKRQQDTDVDYREKIRAHRLAVFIWTTIGIIAFIAFMTVTNILWKQKTFTELRSVSSTPVSIVTSASGMMLGDSILIYSKDGASCIDVKGKAVWNESYEMQSPIVSVSGSSVAIGDYNGRNIYVANKDETLGTIRTNLPIRDLAVSSNGVVAAVLDDSDVIRIFVYNGNEDTDVPIVEAKATMSKSGYPIRVALSPNGKIMMVSYFYVDGGNMKSSVSFYNFGEVGSNKVDNFVSGFDYVNTVMPYVRFMNDTSSFGVSDDRVVFFKGNEIPDHVATALIDGDIVSVYNNTDYVGLVFLNTSGESTYLLDIYDASGNKISSIPFDIDYTDIVFSKDTVIIYGGDDCIVSSVKGQEKFAGKFDKNVRLLLPSNSSYKYTLVTGESVESVELD